MVELEAEAGKTKSRTFNGVFGGRSELPLELGVREADLELRNGREPPTHGAYLPTLTDPRPSWSCEEVDERSPSRWPRLQWRQKSRTHSPRSIDILPKVMVLVFGPLADALNRNAVAVWNCAVAIRSRRSASHTAIVASHIYLPTVTLFVASTGGNSSHVRPEYLQEVTEVGIQAHVRGTLYKPLAGRPFVIVSHIVPIK